MRRFVLTAAALLLSAASLTAGEIKIAWYGQSMFLIVTPKGTRIVCDPHNLEEYRQEDKIRADLVLMSHLHSDHTRLDQIENARTVKQVNALQKTGPAPNAANWNDVDARFKDVHYHSVPTYHDAVSGLQRGKNGCWLIDVDGVRIVHLGDLGHTLNKAQIKKFGKIDVLLVPVGGVYTLNGIDAFKVVRQLQPRRYVVPMHYGTIVYGDLLPLSYFAEECKENKLPIVHYKPRQWLRIDTDAAVPKEPTVAVLNYLGAPRERKAGPKK